MSLVTAPQVNPNDEITDSSVNDPVNALAAVVNGNLDDTNISTFSGSKINAGTVPGTALATEASPYTRLSESEGDFVASGGVWTALTGLNGTMSAAVSYIDGKRLTTALVSSYTFTANRDTYVYIDGTGNVQYNAQTNGNPEPSTPASNLLIAKVVTGGTGISGITDRRVFTSGGRSHYNALFLSTGGSTGGTVISSQAWAPFDASDSEHAVGITATTGSNSYLTVTKSALYQCTIQVSSSDTPISNTTLIVWLKLSFDNGGTWFANRQEDRVLNTAHQQVYSWNYYIPAGTRIAVDFACSNSARLSAPLGSSFQDRYYQGPKLAVVEVK